MESRLSPKFKKWMKKCLNDEFSNTIDENLNGDRDPYDVAQKIINSREMTDHLNAIRNSFVEKIDTSRIIASRQSSAMNSAVNSRPQTSLSYLSYDLSEDDWVGSAKENDDSDEIGKIVDQMGYDKPDHVRLAGYEALLKHELANIMANNSWPSLLKALRDGLVDGSRSVFEASLLVHAKLLNCSRYSGAYANILEAFAELYHSKKLSDTLPTILSGVNFKVFLHEKLFRVMRLLTDHQEEVLKGSRTADKLSEEMIDQFASFLSSHSTVVSAQKKPLNALQIISVLDPHAGWSKKWMHGLTTRKALCSAISKSPSLMHSVVNCVKRGLESSPTRVSVTINDEPADVFISGDSIETFSFLHCLNFLAQLCATTTGRAVLSETQTGDAFSIPDFLSSLLSCLNSLASTTTSNAVYEMIRSALSDLLNESIVLYDARFYQLALNPLLQTELRMWPHTLDVLSHVLGTVDGPSFMTTECRASSASIEKKQPNYPIVTVIAYAANLLKQPVAVMSVEHVTDLFKLIGKLFRIHEVFHVIEEIVKNSFYPSLTYMYSKLDKYYIENENKTQHLDKAVKEMLINLVTIPLGLQMLSNEPLIFEELIRGSITPVRASWSAYDVIGFISNSGFLSRGIEVLTDLAPHVLTTLLLELSKTLEDPQRFHDPWENYDVKVFLHVIALFSLNTKCFLAFMTKESDEEKKEEEHDYVTNLYDLMQRFSDVDSPYHYLDLLALKILLWNLDIYLYLFDLLDFQSKILEFQRHLAYTKEDDFDPQPGYIIDECSLLRNTILINTYYMRHRRSELLREPEETRLFSSLPPPPQSIDDNFVRKTSGDTELAVWLSDYGPGLRDNGWILGTRKAHKTSPGPLANDVILNLLDQMEKAIPTVEWVEGFVWDADLKYSDDYFLPEEKCGIDLVMHYSSINGLEIENTEEAKNNFKLFIQSTYNFIGYNKSKQFDGFDWFLATVFLISNGNVDKAKTFINQILHFPSAMFMWPTLARVIDDNRKEEASVRLLFAHLLESIICVEFPAVKFALKSECGVDWWMICDRLLTQCFWGILPWSEIGHYFAICILHPPDYVLYYCASLLNHCEDNIIKNISKGQMWPEDLILEDYRCHSQIGFMDRLGKRYGGKVLPSLTQCKLSFSDNLISES